MSLSWVTGIYLSPKGDARKINDLLIFDAMKTLEELFLIVLLI
jgi:hypothetical protein